MSSSLHFFMGLLVPWSLHRNGYNSRESAGLALCLQEWLGKKYGSCWWPWQWILGLEHNVHPERWAKITVGTGENLDIFSLATHLTFSIIQGKSGYPNCMAFTFTTKANGICFNWFCEKKWFVGSDFAIISDIKMLLFFKINSWSLIGPAAAQWVFSILNTKDLYSPYLFGTFLLLRIPPG